MSWPFPKSKFNADSILDVQEWNEQVVAFSQEIDGGLNEQNLVDDFGQQCHENGLINPDVGAAVRHISVDMDQSNGAAGLVLRPYTSWTRAGGSTEELSFTSKGGKILIIISFQLSWLLADANPAEDYVSGFNFAIEVNGNVLRSSILGTGDAGNEYLVGDPNASIRLDSSPSFKDGWYALVCTDLLTVPPGEYIIHLVYRSLYATSGASFAEANLQNYNFIAIDLWS